MPRYFLGIDGGGTKTEAAIVDETGRLLGSGQGGPSNYDDVGVAQTRDSIAVAVASARRNAGLSDNPLAAAFLGMAGVVSAADRSVIGGIASDLGLAEQGRIGVDHDCRIALAGGLSGRPGIVLIVGTGSSCFGMNAAGEGWRAGGWGQLLADEGSSYWLGLRAMQIAVGSYDGRLGATTLLAQVQRYLGLEHLDEIMHRLYVEGLSRSEIAALAPLVVAAANDGDKQALALIGSGATALADCVLAVARRLELSGESCEVTMVGGLLRAGAVVEEPLRAAILERLPRCHVHQADSSPVLGACLLAQSLVARDVDAVVTNVANF